MVRQQVSSPEKSKNECHHSISNLLGARNIHMDQSEAEIGGECGVDGAIGGTEAENQLRGAEAALGGAWEERERVEQHGGGGLDSAIGKAVESDVRDDGDSGE